ncbi:biotin/lipoyl-binding protein [Dankookia sp. P2]|uniref:biotin/lipoyl-binding protein n=1 Tax=Dankookia sp. P2 TaxID=3423955 RepID=UPI003D674C8B
MPEGSIRTGRGVDAETVTPAEVPPKRRRWLRPVLMIGGVLVVAAGAGAFWLHGGRYAGTDDAYVQADKLLLATDVAGIVRTIAVHEGDMVKAGQELVMLDPAPSNMPSSRPRRSCCRPACRCGPCRPTIVASSMTSRRRRRRCSWPRRPMTARRRS